MGKKSILKKSRVKIGEIIRATDVLGAAMEGIYKVEGRAFGFISLSAGSIYINVLEHYLVVLERNLPEPVSWKEIERKMFINNPHADNCPDCRLLREEALREEAVQ